MFVWGVVLYDVLQQKLAKKDGSIFDRNRDIENLWEFYQAYKQRYKVEDIQKEEEKWRESGTFTTKLGEYGIILPFLSIFFYYDFGLICVKYMVSHNSHLFVNIFHFLLSWLLCEDNNTP